MSGRRSMASGGHKRSRKDIALALALGWTMAGYSGTGRMRFTHPDVGRALYLCGGPSDWRAEKNNMSLIRRISPKQE